jgi:hypothetical protein
MATSPAGISLRAAISEQKLRELYVAQGLSIAGVAGCFGVAATTIGRRLRELGVPARPRGPIPWSRPAREPLEWTTDLAWVVGLIATDGNLSRKPGRIAIMSNDTGMLELVRQRLGLRAAITPHRGGYGHRCHRIVWSSRRFYDWLLDIGLTPAKSLTLGPLAVPDEYFRDFFRGCVDGDGSILTYVDRYNTSKHPSYVYTRLYVSMVSASFLFIDWLRAAIQRLAKLSGDVGLRKSPGRHDIWRLRYAKRESLALLRWIYYAPDVACLARKQQVAAPFLAPRPVPAVRPPGRPMVG